MSFLFFLYFVSVRWKHFISVEYYGVKKWWLEDWNCVNSIITINSELWTGFHFLCTEGKVNLVFIMLSFYFHFKVYSDLWCLYDLRNLVTGEMGQPIWSHQGAWVNICIHWKKNVPKKKMTVCMLERKYFCSV